MEQTQLVVRKRVAGRIEYNDGDFAEVQTVGIEGIEEDLLLETLQIHRENTNDRPEEFQRRFPVGMWLDILTTTDITAQPEESSLQNDGDEEDGQPRGFVQ